MMKRTRRELRLTIGAWALALFVKMCADELSKESLANILKILEELKNA